MDRLELLAKTIERLREDARALESEPFGPMSEQFFLTALAHLDAAQRQVTIAMYHRMRKD